MGTAPRADLLEVRWPSGLIDKLTDVRINRIAVIQEGKGELKG